MKQAGDALAGIDEAIRRGATDDVRHLAHKLAGSSSTCGMTAVAAPLMRLEQLAKRGDLCDAAAIHAETNRQMERVHRFLNDYMKSNSVAIQGAYA